MVGGRIILLIVALGVIGGLAACANAADASKGLRVSENHRYLEYKDGSPFLYLGDTAWELFHRLNREEADRYLANRAAKGFTVIQAVVLAQLEGLDDPNPYGHKPLIDNDPTKPNEAYFQHVDYVVNKARGLGLVIGMLPTWGCWWKTGSGIFTPENAKVYGRFLGLRYKFMVRVNAIRSRRVQATWFDPRYGVTEPIHTTDTPSFQTFVPPTSGRGCDWLLVLDDATASFPTPGQAKR